MSDGRLDTFRERVEIILMSKGWSKADLATALGVTMPAVYQLLDRGSPSVSTLQKWSKVLGVSMAELLRPVTPAELGAAIMATKKENNK